MNEPKVKRTHQVEELVVRGTGDLSTDWLGVDDDDAWYKRKGVPPNSQVYVDPKGIQHAVIDYVEGEDTKKVAIIKKGVAVFYFCCKDSAGKRHTPNKPEFAIPLTEGMTLVSDAPSVQSNAHRFTDGNVNSIIRTTTTVPYSFLMTYARAWG